MVAAVPAPAETPMVPGSARGLRMTDWRRAPAAAREAPIKMARMIRGRRRLMTIVFIADFSSLKSARRISGTEYPALPTAIETRQAAASRIRSASSTVPTRRSETCLPFFIPLTPQSGPQPYR